MNLEPLKIYIVINFRIHKINQNNPNNHITNNKKDPIQFPCKCFQIRYKISPNLPERQFYMKNHSRFISNLLLYN